MRYLSLIGDSLMYGPLYGYLKFLIHSPKPLDPDWIWNELTVSKGWFVDWVRENVPPPWARRFLLARKQRQDAKLGIAAHYDVSNDFYKLFLDDRYMFYSCADHLKGDESLEDAQRKKADFLCELIAPEPGQRILELGCGWGSMLKRISEATGDRENLWGYTLSCEQKAYNDSHNHFQVELKNFITADYPEEHFDAIYSVGAWEHVRPQEIVPLLTKLHRALKPGGRLVKHFFCRLTDPLPAASVASQLFFPGSIGSSFRFHRQAFEQSGFRILHTSVHDYRPTLRDWFDNLVARRDEAIRLVGIPTYNRYLIFFAASWRYFDEGTGMLFRFGLQKPPVNEERLIRVASERGALAPAFSREAVDQPAEDDGAMVRGSLHESKALGSARPR